MGAETFTSLMSDLHQDKQIAGALMEHLLEGISLIRHWSLYLRSRLSDKICAKQTVA